MAMAGWRPRCEDMQGSDWFIEPYEPSGSGPFAGLEGYWTAYVEVPGWLSAMRLILVNRQGKAVEHKGVGFEVLHPSREAAEEAIAKYKLLQAGDAS